MVVVNFIEKVLRHTYHVYDKYWIPYDALQFWHDIM